MDVQQETFEIEVKIHTIPKAFDFLWRIAEVIRVKPTAFNVQLYPIITGEGGCGLTAILFFVESFCIIDSWPESRYVNVNIVSCKPFSRLQVEIVIQAFIEREERKNGQIEIDFGKE